MTPKSRLETLLAGGTPDLPPTWELVFQIPKPMFGIDLDAAWEKGIDHARGAYLETTHRLIEECGWAAVPAINSYNADELRLHREAMGGKALEPGFEGSGVFWMLPGDQMEEFAMRLFEDPEGLHAEARQKCDTAMLSLRELADAGADFFVLTYDFGYNQAPFVSPKHFDEFVAPYLAEIVAVAHELGKVAILHSDGCIDKVLDSIVATGIDGYQSVDPQGHMDIRKVRERYPNLLLMGNVPCNLLQDDDYGAIRSAVRECMNYGGIGKRYIFSTSNCIFNGMPPESYRTMLDEYQTMLKETK